MASPKKCVLALARLLKVTLVTLPARRRLMDHYYDPSQFQPFFGGHSGIGPPSGAGTLGTAAYTYVPTRPTSRINALSERFIVFLLGYTSTSLHVSGGQSTCARIIHELTKSRFLNYVEFCHAGGTADAITSSGLEDTSLQ